MGFIELKCKPAFTLAASVLTLFVLGSAGAAAKSKPNQIKYEYVPPKDAAYQTIYDQMKQGHALEHLRELLSPLRLPHPLTLKVTGCDGDMNAFYYDEVVTICYELLADIVKNAPTGELPSGVSKADTIIGPVLSTFLHETGHAVFDLLEIPVLGREEDAADQFAAYVMLRLGQDEARRMVLGSAYLFKADASGPVVKIPIQEFSDEHSLPAQRAFSILCLAYGADKKVFADVVEQGFLPKERAESCEAEYEDLSFAMTKLISPHIDKALARKSHAFWSRTIGARRARLARQADQLKPK